MSNQDKVDQIILVFSAQRRMVDIRLYSQKSKIFEFWEKILSCDWASKIGSGISDIFSPCHHPLKA